jgi:hypothetical protein
MTYREARDVTKEEARDLRRRIREADDIIATLQEMAREYQFRMESSWGDLPLADILISGPDNITCLFPGMGSRNFSSVKKFSYRVKFGCPRRYGDRLYGDDATGVHDYTGS